MPRRMKTKAEKVAAGTFKPGRHRESPAPMALTEWPKAPAHFSKAEAHAWQRLGAAVLELGTASKADLLFCERVAQVTARVDHAMLDPDFKPTALNALLRLESDLRKQIGLTPQARGAVSPLAAEEEQDEDDPLSEFGR